MIAAVRENPKAAREAGRASPEGLTVPAPTLGELFLVFTRIGFTAFGGGITGWTMREVVDNRRWMTPDDFLTGLAMSQALPGVNVVNLAIWMGYRLGGGRGALIAALGIILPAAGIIACLASLFNRFAHGPDARMAFAGAAAAAIGLSLSVSVRSAARSARRAAPALIMAAAFVAIGLLKISIVPVVLVLGPLGVAIEAGERRRRA